MNQDAVEIKAPKDKLPFRRAVLSVIQAAFGVQSSANRERDFATGKLLPFVIAAVLLTAGLVAALIVTVRLVLAS